MRFTILAIVIAIGLFVGYFGINYAIQKITFEPVNLETLLLPKTSAYPTGMLYLADTQRESYNVNSFSILLNNSDVSGLSSLKTSLLIIDPQEDDQLRFTKQEMQQIKENKKYLIAYLDIGYAYDNQDYWNKLPSDVLGKELEYKYLVAFWQPEWKNIIYSRITDYLNLGYDGVYLSGLDAYKYWNGVDSKTRMISFVEDLSNKIKAKDGEALVLSDSEFIQESNYINYIDGLVSNNVFYTNNEKIIKDVLLEDLRFAIKKGKFVLSIDYSKGLNNRCNFINQSKANKFIPFVASKDLDLIPSFNCDMLNYIQ